MCWLTWWRVSLLRALYWVVRSSLSRLLWLDALGGVWQRGLHYGLLCEEEQKWSSKAAVRHVALRNPLVMPEQSRVCKLKVGDTGTGWQDLHLQQLGQTRQKFSKEHWETEEKLEVEMVQGCRNVEVMGARRLGRCWELFTLSLFDQWPLEALSWVFALGLRFLPCQSKGPGAAGSQ